MVWATAPAPDFQALPGPQSVGTVRADLGTEKAALGMTMGCAVPILASCCS